jgi:hypothetical protein
VKATVAQIEMSLTQITKASKGKGPATTTNDSEDAAPPASARNKSGRFTRQQRTEDAIDESGTAAPTIPSGSRAIDEGTPVDSTVEDANDQLSEAIPNPSHRPAIQGNRRLIKTFMQVRILPEYAKYVCASMILGKNGSVAEVELGYGSTSASRSDRIRQISPCPPNKNCLSFYYKLVY